jgi:protein-S-isoprenylcysteine O-methyltransferase Ste14
MFFNDNYYGHCRVTRSRVEVGLGENAEALLMGDEEDRQRETLFWDTIFSASEQRKRWVMLLLGHGNRKWKMRIFAEHSLGIFNLWLLMVLYTLPILFTIIIRKRIFQTTSSHFSSSRSSREYHLFIVSKFLMLIYFLYSIAIPIRLDTLLAISGFVFYLIGFGLYSAAWITIAKSERGKVFTRGPFRFSRHPVYISSAVLFIGAGFISQSWFFLGLSILVGISHMHNALAEEKICLETFGEEYRQYMVRTPRWIGGVTRKSNDPS